MASRFSMSILWWCGQMSPSRLVCCLLERQRAPLACPGCFQSLPNILRRWHYSNRHVVKERLSEGRLTYTPLGEHLQEPVPEGPRALKNLRMLPWAVVNEMVTFACASALTTRRITLVGILRLWQDYMHSWAFGACAPKPKPAPLNASPHR